MSDAVISILAICAGLMLIGTLLGLIDRRNFSFRWLFIATLLVFLNDAALTRLYGLLPAIPGSDYNWTGKLLALVVTLAVVSHPAFGWKRSGLTVAHRGSWRSVLPVSLLLIALFTWLAISGDSGQVDSERLAFQLTLPGFEEEPFYRGILLLAFAEAFRGRVRALGIDWGWGALLSSVLFGLTHAFDVDDGTFSFDFMAFLLTGGPAIILVWLRERTGSLLLPVLLHNYANSAGLLL